jgi:Flp pilus assembly pilin Flp
VAATGTVGTELTPKPALDSDGFSVGTGGAVDMSSAANAHWLGVSWDVERAIVALTVEAASATTSTPATAARVRMFSAGNWLPLAPRDMLAFANGKASVRFPACAASRLMFELQAENKINDKWSGVLVPGAVNISNLKVSVLATPQPCHVSVAVADDAPFFRFAGPLPAQAMAVDGLARALNRFLSDNPGATAIPLTLRAAAPSRLVITAFEAVLDLANSGQPPAPPPPPPPRPEQPGTQPAGNPSTLRGRWCRPQRLAAQAFAALPAGRGLSAVELWVRPLGSAAALRGSLSLHADDAGRPAAEPLMAPMAWHYAGDAAASQQWLRCELPLPALAPPGLWWALLRVEEGELLWYQEETPPTGAGAGMVQAGAGPWMPVQPGTQAWLQARLQLIEAVGRS